MGLGNDLGHASADAELGRRLELAREPSAFSKPVGGLVIVNGVTFIAFLTATITSFFVSAERDEAKQKEPQHDAAELDQVIESLSRIERRITEIERKLGD